MSLEQCFDGTMIDPDLPISQNYCLKDLCVTNQTLSTSNLPNQSSQEYKNLCWLATVLEELSARFGAFDILSGWRCPELQGILNPSIAAAGKRGFHEAGMGVDIYPKDISTEEFFCRILTSDMKEKLGEIAIKPSQNSLHLSLPTEKTRGIAMEMDEGKAYRRLSADEVQTKYLNEYLNDGSSVYGGMSTSPVSDTPTEEMSSLGQEESIEEPSKLPLILGAAALLIGVAAYFGLKKK